MKYKKFNLLKIVTCLTLLMLIIIACNNDDVNINKPTTVNFNSAPDATILSTGNVEIITENTVRYHVLNFNAGGYTSTIVETETTATLIDVGSQVNEGAEMRAYANAINKPLSVIITHDHPDHYGNISNFSDVPVFAHTEAAADLAANTGFTTMYSTAINVVDDSQVIGGLEFKFANIPNAETAENGYIFIPSLGVLFPGDLMYNGRHNYIREYTPLDSVDELDNWITGLNQLKNDFGNYNRVFVGHIGTHTDIPTLIDANIEYLRNAQGLIKGTKELTSGSFATSVQEVVDELALLYPNLISGALTLALPDAFFPGDPGANWFE
ncbi:MBL fold metallo-hydrolase [Tenacibaculum sp. 190524A02b]|uniref:Glyoxylase-like metal-dependent hydrolase (Beta-lactamase superfamily II) n=1 Tax=Tenacibaculum vairaonense TaxID=3137860 RepID=A0ABM9PNF5_9FLAO